MDNKKFNKLIKEALTPDFLKEDTMPSQGEVNSFFEHSFDDLHYLNSKPVGEWDEYDLSNWESKKRKRMNEAYHIEQVIVYNPDKDMYYGDSTSQSPRSKKKGKLVKKIDNAWLLPKSETHRNEIIAKNFGGVILKYDKNVEAEILKLKKKANESVNEDARGAYADIPTLNKHPDILNLIKNVQELVGIGIYPDLRGYGGTGKGFYLTTPSLKFWEDDDKNLLKDAFNKTNNESGELTFEFQITDNYEMDPGERSWDAAFGFTVDEKI